MTPVGDALLARPGDFRHPENIGLVLRHREKGDRRIGGIHFGNDIQLHLWVDLDGDVGEQLRHSDYRKTIVHEFIHVFDSERMNVMAPTSRLSNNDYYNHPVEINAYYQEAVSHFETTFSNMPPSVREQQLNRVSGSFDEFLSLMRVMLDNSFLDARRLRTDRALVRRLYRYWDEMVRTRSI